MWSLLVKNICSPYFKYLPLQRARIPLNSERTVNSMALREFSEADRTSFVNFVELAINDGVFPRTELNTAVLHCLVYIGCQPENWRTVLGQKSAHEVAWFSRQSPPRLSPDALLALSAAVSLSAKGFAIDVPKKQITSFNRPMHGQFVSAYMDFKSKIAEIGVAKLDKECESMFLLAAMQPPDRLLYGNGFMSQQPEVSRTALGNTLLPLFKEARENKADVHRDLATLLPHMIVNYQDCGLSQWATNLTQDHKLAKMQAETQGWSSEKFQSEIASAQNRKADLSQWVSPAVAGKMTVSRTLDSMSMQAMSKNDLRQWYSRVKDDIELLCDNQPKASERLVVLHSRLQAEQKRRAEAIPKVALAAKNDNAQVRAAAQPIAAPNFTGLSPEEQIKRTAAYIEQESKTTDFLSGFMAVGLRQ